MVSTNSAGQGDDPDPSQFLELKQFRSAGRGFWSDVSEAEWSDHRWQLKNRVTSLEQLQRLMPLTPEEEAGCKLANTKSPRIFSISSIRRTRTVRSAVR
jgi:hypothetical protein